MDPFIEDGRLSVFVAVTGRGSTTGAMVGPDRFAVVCILTCAIACHCNKYIYYQQSTLHFKCPMTTVLLATLLFCSWIWVTKLSTKVIPLQTLLPNGCTEKQSSEPRNIPGEEPAHFGSRFCFSVLGSPCLKYSRKNYYSRIKFCTIILQMT